MEWAKVRMEFEGAAGGATLGGGAGEPRAPGMQLCR